MKISIKWGICCFILGVVIFLLSPGLNSMITNTGFWNLKEESLYLTGSIALVLMTLTMVLSIRLRLVNNIMGGLDKAYIIHKWVGIYAIVFSVIHWIVKEGPGILLDLGLVPPKVKGGGPSPYTDMEDFLYHLGNDIVEYAFYIIVAVVLISLLKKIPYHIFRYIHKTIPVLFLLIAFHSLTIQIKGFWFGSMGSVILNIILFIGTVVALIDLFQLIGKSNKRKAIVKNLNYDKDNKVLDITLEAVDKDFDYKAGQYVFLTIGKSKEPHPFSVASYDKGMREIRFLIKELGDYTKELVNHVKVGDSAIIEGAYGNFTFDDSNDHQIWIGAGIGITPFMSRLAYLAEHGNNKKIDFYFTSRGENSQKAELEEMSKKCNVDFHFIDTTKSGRLNIETLEEKSKNLSNSSIWYCGPVGFCKYLLKALTDRKIPVNIFHFDNFDMR